MGKLWRIKTLERVGLDVIIDYVKLGILAAVLAAVTGGGYIGYNHIKDIGYKEAQAECQAKFDELEAKQNKRVEELQTVITQTADNLITNNQILTSDISRIVGGLKKGGQPTTIIKEGKCTPSPTFVNSLNEAIDRANAGASGK